MNEGTQTLYLDSYFVRDTHGNVANTTAWERDDVVYIAVKNGEEGQYNLIYDGEAKHLSDWCKLYGLQLRHQIIEIEVPDPFDLE